MVRKLSSGFLRAVCLVYVIIFFFGLSCARQEYKVEISATDWDYDESSNRLTLSLQAHNTGELSVKSVKCNVNIKSTFTPYSSPIASKSVTFAGGGKISPGGTANETVIFYNLNLNPYVNWKIEVTDVEADPVTKGGCSNPLS